MCPNCKKKQKGGILKWIIIAIVAIIIIGAIAGGNKGSDKTTKVGEVTTTTAVASADTTAEQPAEEAPAEADTAEPAAADTQTVFHVGDILQDGDLEIVYMSSGEHVEENEFLQPAEGNKYIYIQLAFKNTSTSKDVSVSMFNF